VDVCLSFPGEERFLSELGFKDLAALLELGLRERDEGKLTQGDADLL